MELLLLAWVSSSTPPLRCLESSTQELGTEKPVEVRSSIHCRLGLSQGSRLLHQSQLSRIRGDSAMWLGHVADCVDSMEQTS